MIENPGGRLWDIFPKIIGRGSENVVKNFTGSPIFGFYFIFMKNFFDNFP